MIGVSVKHLCENPKNQHVHCVGAIPQVSISPPPPPSYKYALRASIYVNDMRVLSACPLRNKEGKSMSIFLDSSSGRQRNTYANDMVPCITPSHGVYSSQLGRYVTAKEFLGLQAIWEVDANNPQNFQDMVNTIGQDLAGNSFTGTVVQAVLLTQLSTSTAWFDLELRKDTVADAEPQQTSVVKLELSDSEPMTQEPARLEAGSVAGRSKKRKAESQDEQLEQSPPESRQKPMKRLWGKQPAPDIAPLKCAKKVKKDQDKETEEGKVCLWESRRQHQGAR